MRYLPVLGFNTNQWWIYDDDKNVYIDPPIEVLEKVKNLDNDEAETFLEELTNANPTPSWIFDKDYRYNAERIDI